MIIFSTVFKILNKLKGNLILYTVILLAITLFNTTSGNMNHYEATKPDILIVDEVLSVGDYHFQQKCEARINWMKEQGTTILFVSHNTEQIKALCNRVIWLEHGRIRRTGTVEEVCQEYQRE